MQCNPWPCTARSLTQWYLTSILPRLSESLLKLATVHVRNFPRFNGNQHTSALCPHTCDVTYHGSVAVYLCPCETEGSHHSSCHSPKRRVENYFIVEKISWESSNQKIFKHKYFGSQIVFNKWFPDYSMLSYIFLLIMLDIIHLLALKGVCWTCTLACPAKTHSFECCLRVHLGQRLKSPSSGA